MNRTNINITERMDRLTSGSRPVLSVVLAGDHRATDGQTGSRLLEKLNEQLQQPADL